MDRLIEKFFGLCLLSFLHDRKQSLVFRVVLLALLIWSLAGGIAQAATINVAAGAVAATNDGVCSLREAIQNANADAQVGNPDCPAGSGADTIELASGSTYTLPDGPFGLSGLPGIASSITINGNGATIQRNPILTCNLNGVTESGEFRIFFVSDSGDLSLIDVTVSRGCADGPLPAGDGGGIRIDGGNVTIANSTVFGNNAQEGGHLFPRRRE